MEVRVIHVTDIVKSKTAIVDRKCHEFLKQCASPTILNHRLKRFPGRNFSVFLAGGASTDWREEVEATTIKTLGEHKDPNFDTVYIFDPKTNGIGKRVNYSQLIEWEKFFLERPDILAFNFEKSETDQPFSLFELGRYAPMKLESIGAMGDQLFNGNIASDSLVVNVHREYRQRFGMTKQLELMIADNCIHYKDKILLPEYMEPEQFGKEISIRVERMMDFLGWVQ